MKKKRIKDPLIELENVTEQLIIQNSKLSNEMNTLKKEFTKLEEKFIRLKKSHSEIIFLLYCSLLSRENVKITITDSQIKDLSIQTAPINHEQAEERL